MTEKEYCIDNFEERFEWAKEKRLALYGTGESARAIIERYSDWPIICLVSDEAAGIYIWGYYVVSFAQMLDLDVDCLLIPNPISETEDVYTKISERCSANRIKVYNLYGKDMHMLHKSLLEKNVQYPKIWEMSIKNAIEDHEIVSFDLDKTTFTSKYLWNIDFYMEIEHELQERKIEIPNFADRLMTLESQDRYSSMEQLAEQLAVAEKMNLEQRKEVRELICEKVMKMFVPRTAMLEVIKDAIACGKKVCLIEDRAECRLSKKLWEKVLREHGIVGYDDIACSSDYGVDKWNGLYRAIKEKYGEDMYLHVGSDLESDILIPQLYDIDTFLVKSAEELYKRLDPIASQPVDDKEIRQLIAEYILDVYNEDYLMFKAEQSRVAAQDTTKILEEKLWTYQNCDRSIEYRPTIFEKIKEESNVESYPKIQFEEYQKPQVSIVIPVYNQFVYTYNCLKSIKNHTKDVTYEVIIADDCSTDQVKELEKVVLGAVVVHNKENLRFLLNCNNAATYAKGEYILFLNNDTQVQENWLRPLVEVMEQHKDAGMVGSKLVYPDGHLQEAGGILWKDGSAWNYGHMKNPMDPEFMYVKETDYVSGASIMIRTTLWKEIGGFDPDFAPAYYEDTDLAFEVRKHGYQVMFQPKSIVVHFEGVSNGKDTSTGLKNYQIVNQKKFYEKWKDVLEREHFDNGTEVYLAKDRGQTKKQILVVDHYVPNYDKDAGGRCTFMYLKAFLDMGMKVTFVGDNFARPEPYTTILNQLGIEVLCGNYYYNNWREWMKENLKCFDYIYLQRPHISIKYIDLVKEYGRGKIFYFAHDLHYVRMYRDYQVTGNPESLKESEYWKNIELELFEKADVGHVVGSYEQKVMQDTFPDKPIRNIPLYIYDKMPEKVEKDFSKRKDILFVGGFGHTPNIDAVIWFANEIFPRLLEKYPELIWHIVGSNAPEQIKDLANEHIILEGFVTDEKLGELYRKCRLVVVPLRYGAGVKGKIVESAYYQIPVVTTSIGGEGIDASVGSFIMEDDADKMAELIEQLYMDYDELRRMSDAGVQLVQRYFTSEAARHVLSEDIDI